MTETKQVKPIKTTPKTYKECKTKEQLREFYVLQTPEQQEALKHLITAFALKLEK